MSAYLKFHQLERSPFDGQAQSQVVLGTKALRDAFTTIQSGLEEGAARICVSGGPGMGKTSLARALPKLLGDDLRVAVVRNPSASWSSLRGTIARQWGLSEGGLPRAKLLQVAREHRLVLVVDQAEKANSDFLDHLDVMLCYRSEDERPVVQSVLLANLSTEKQGEPNPLIWWLDRIHTLQLVFAPLPRDGVGPYIDKHLKRAGWQGESLFTAEAAHTIHEYTGGIPGEVGKLCEKLLAVAAENDLHEIESDLVHRVCEPPETARDPVARDQSEEWVVDIDGDDDEPHEMSATDAGMPGGEASFDSILPDDRASFGSDDANAWTDASDQTDERPAGEAAAEHAPEDWDEDEDFANSGAHDPSAIEANGESSDEETAILSLEEFLSQPATAEELRALIGGGFSRYARTVVAIAAAIAIVAIGIGLLMGGESESEEASLVGLEPTTSSPTQNRAGDEAAPVLARMRGPVLNEDGVDPAPTGADETEPEVHSGSSPATESSSQPRRPETATRQSIPDTRDATAPAAPQPIQ